MATQRILIFSKTLGYRHASIPMAAQTVVELGAESGAYACEQTEELEAFEAGNLSRFDALCFNQTTGELPFTDQQKRDILEFVAGGRAFIGLHAAADCLYQWREYGELVGGYFDGHPWLHDCTVRVKVDDPTNPINASFGGQSFDLTDEIYQFKEPYDRTKLRVLLSLDVTKTDMTRKGIKRTDGDFALGWIKPYGKGRVFYTALGHNDAVWQRADVRQHVFTGIRWALGQIEAPTAPIRMLAGK